MTLTKQTSAPSARFTYFHNTSNWCDGEIGTYRFTAQLFDKQSEYGIASGRVSKLYIINKRNELVARYERGWDIRPRRIDKPYFKAIMTFLENAPKRLKFIRKP